MKLPPPPLPQRRVLVTAGASGIGLAMARAFAAAGDRVTVTDIDEGALAALPDGIEGLHADVADAAGMDALHARAERDGGFGVVCANAGVKGPTAAVEDIDPAEWRESLAINLDGLFHTVRGAAAGMKRRGRGVILVTSSTSGIYGTPYRSPYVAAKWAAIGLVRTWAMELGPHGVRVNAILPGSVNGPRIDRVIAAEAAAKGMTPEAVRQGYEAGTAMRTLVDAGDVAALALFLASDGAARISGQAIAVDGFTVNPDPQP